MCKVTFSFSGHRLRESLHMTVSALDVLTDRRGVRIGFFLKTLVVLSFLVPELGDDFGRTWPRDTRNSFPETELSVRAVHVANFAFSDPLL